MVFMPNSDISLLSFQTVHQNDYDQDPYAKEFGIIIDSKLASVEARVLPAPWVMLKGTLLLHVTFNLVLPTTCSLCPFSVLNIAQV